MANGTTIRVLDPLDVTRLSQKNSTLTALEKKAMASLQESVLARGNLSENDHGDKRQSGGSRLMGV